MIPPYKGPALQNQVNIELGNSSEYQLYNLKDDPGQKTNLAQTNPDKLEEMKKMYQQIRGSGSRIEQLELK
jgi:arylsulfatase A-like enzyme